MKDLKEPTTLKCSNCKHEWRPRQPFKYCPHCKCKKKPIGNIPESLKCKRCDNEWVPRLGIPGFCPKCKSSRWDADSFPKIKKQRIRKALIREVIALHEDGATQRAIAKIVGTYHQKVAEIIRKEEKATNEHPMDEFIELIFSPQYDIDFVGDTSIMEGMARPRKQERNNEIVLKKDEMDWSFRKIADHYNLDVSTVHEIYQREKGTGSSGSLGLSTGNDLTPLGN